MMPHSAARSRYVFVYGTLRAGGSNDIARFTPAAERVADGQIAGVLYDLGAYPGAVLGGDQCVKGEIYRIDAALEAQLDALEEVGPDDTGEYIKREVLVEAGGRQWSCLVYEIHPSRIKGRSVIVSGDWFGHR